MELTSLAAVMQTTMIRTRLAIQIMHLIHGPLFFVRWISILCIQELASAMH